MNKVYLTKAEQAIRDHKTRRPALSFRGQDTKPPSKVDTSCSTFAVPDKVYTGTAMLGVATMHKSNAVPVFSTESAEDISRMRR